MRIVAMSDSHGDSFALEQVFRKTAGSGNVFVHLGDGERELDMMRLKYPDLDIRHVAGNCDYHSMSPNIEIIFACVSDYKLMTFVFIIDDVILGLTMQDAFRTVGRPFFNERTFIQFLFVETNLSLPYLFVILSFVTSVFELVTVDQLGIQDTFTTESRRGILQELKMSVEIYRNNQ